MKEKGFSMNCDNLNNIILYFKDSLDQEYPSVPFSHFQTIEYEKLLRSYGQVPVWLIATQNGVVLATWLLFETRENYLNPRFHFFLKHIDVNLHSLHGPTLSNHLDDSFKMDLINLMLNALKERIEKKKYITVKITFSPVFTDKEKEAFANCGISNGYMVNKYYTYLLAIDKNQEENFKKIQANKRTKIRKMEKMEVEIIEINNDQDINYYYDLRVDTILRNKNNKVLFKHFSDTFNIMPRNIYKIFIAKVNNRVGAGQTLFSYNGYVYLSGVSIAKWARDEKIDINDYLQWKIIDWCCENKIQLLDYVGADPYTEDVKIKNIDKFKSSWGSNLVSSIELSYKSESAKKMAYITLKKASKNIRNNLIHIIN